MPRAGEPRSRLQAAPPAPPANPLACRRLNELGVTLGGLAALEATVAELVRLTQARGGR